MGRCARRRTAAAQRPAPPAREGPALGEEQSHADVAAAAGTLDTVVGRRRPARHGLLVQFESRPVDVELARLVDATIWINDAHPAFRRAVASRSLGYHTALAAALALAPLAGEEDRVNETDAHKTIASIGCPDHAR